MATPTRKERRFLPKPDGWGLRTTATMMWWAFNLTLDDGQALEW